jgi:glycosyltransferase involved in cell wall biosynthesis
MTAIQQHFSATVLTVVVTAHSEGTLIIPTLRSLSAAASNADFNCELIVVLDNADGLTSKIVDEFTYDEAWASTKVVKSDAGDASAARNVGVANAQGEYVAVIDGDDLVSANYFQFAVNQLRLTPDVIVHPEVIISFGARDIVWLVCASSNLDISHRSVIEHNYWPSSHVATREILKANPYRSLPPSGGFGPEDWYWNIITLSRGIAHLPVAETAFFYRVKSSAGINVQHARSILPKLPLPKLRSALPGIDGGTVQQRTDSQNRFSKRAFVRRMVVQLARSLRPVVKALTCWINPNIVRTLSRPVLFTYRRIFVSEFGRIQREIANVRASFDAITDIEPALSQPLERVQNASLWLIKESEFAVILDSIVRQLEGCEAIVAVPWIGVGGADLVALNYAKALHESAEFHSSVAILTFHDPDRTKLDLIPPGIKLVQMPSNWRTIHPDLHSRLIANIVIQVDPMLILAINGFDIVDALKVFGRQITQNTMIFASLFSWDRTKHGYPTNPITDSAEREHLDYLEALITDNPATANKLQADFGRTASEVLVHLQPAPEVPNWSADRAISVDFNEQNPFIVVWPHRLDKEKRPDSLVRIAEKARDRKLPVRFEVWGSSVLNDQEAAVLDAFSRAGIVYKGPYTGGLGDIPRVEEYHAMLLTSENEGIPLALVQAQMLGIPLVASSVGGVPHIVQHQSTGLLADGPEDIDGFVTALERLMNDAELRYKLQKQGFDYAFQNHSWHSFAGRVRDDIIIPSLKKRAQIS